MNSINLRDYTDIHIHTTGPVSHENDSLREVVDVHGSLLYPGAKSATEEHASLFYELITAAKAHKKADFMVEVKKSFFRVRRDDYAVGRKPGTDFGEWLTRLQNWTRSD